MNIEKRMLDGVEIIAMSVGDYEAVVVPSAGGNVLSYRNSRLDLDILHPAPNVDILKKHAMVFGIPPLMPPGRIEDGTYSFEGKEYIAPINDKENHCWIHGLVTRKSWTLDEIKEDEERAIVRVSYTHDENQADYSYYPFKFRYETKYVLSNNGLETTSTIYNLGDTNMPMALGFHTSFALPIGKQGRLDDLNLRVSIADKWEMKENSIPSENVVALDSDEVAFTTGGNDPLCKELDDLYTSSKIDIDGVLKNAAVLEDRAQNIRVVYECDESIKFWVLWNCKRDGRFICLEPQTSATNIFNHKDKVKGNFIVIEPAKYFTTTSRIYSTSLTLGCNK